ncbi:MAG: hypothetical protein HOM96_03865 [Rickettsiales bacterium]|nr:hypothetical protein [Rickettsiales bacterium]
MAVKDPNFAEGKSIAIGSHFNQAVKSAMANSGFDISDKNKDAIESLTKSIAQDLGFIYSNKDGQTSLVSYDGKNAKMDNAYNPKELEHKDQGILKDTSPKQQKAFLSAMETSGIIDNGQVVKAASRSQIIGCCKVAGIHINSDSREMQNSIKHLQEKAKSVAIVPSWNDRVNMNKKLEAGFIGAVGTSSAILGAVSILAMFSGFAVLAAASMAVTFAGITIASSLVVRDAVNEASASIKNNNLTNAHKELKEEALNKFKTAKTDKEKQGARSEFVEHQMQEKLYNIRAQENAGISGANTIFMASIAIAAITVLGLFGGIGAGMAALATGASFIAGTGVMVGTKKYFGKEANHVSRDLKEFDNLVKNRQEGKLVDSQIQRLEELETKYINQEIQDIEAEIDTKINVDNPAYKKEAKPTLDVNNSKSQQAAPGNNTTPEQKIVELLGNHNNNIKCPIREGLKSVKLQGKKTLEESKATKHKSEENNKEGDNISI